LLNWLILDLLSSFCASEFKEPETRVFSAETQMAHKENFKIKQAQVKNLLF